MLTCRELIEFLDDYLSGDLTPARRADFDEHLAICPPCVNYIQSYQETVRLGKEAFADLDAQVPPAVPEELIRTILDARTR